MNACSRLNTIDGKVFPFPKEALRAAEFDYCNYQLKTSNCKTVSQKRTPLG